MPYLIIQTVLSQLHFALLCTQLCVVLHRSLQKFEPYLVPYIGMSGTCSKETKSVYTDQTSSQHGTV